MINKVIATRYAKALIKLASSEEELTTYQNELRMVLEILNKDEKIMKILGHPGIKVEEKVQLLENLLAEEYLASSLRRFISLLVEKNRLLLLEDIYSSFEDISNKLQNKVKGTIVAAVPIDEEKKALLEEKFSKMLGLAVELEVKINKNILGGLVIQVGDLVVDGSIKRRLRIFRKMF